MAMEWPGDHDDVHRGDLHQLLQAPFSGAFDRNQLCDDRTAALVRKWATQQQQAWSTDHMSQRQLRRACTCAGLQAYQTTIQTHTWLMRNELQPL